jgi:hypothetical protein
MGTRISGEPHWPDVVTGEVPAAIKVTVDRLKKRKIDHVEIDLALSAMLACLPSAPMRQIEGLSGGRISGSS